MKPRLLDLYCGAGGAAMGYHQAGFDVVGIDIKPQPHYPFEFHQADASWYAQEFGRTGGFVAVHASPPCQRFSTMTARHGQEQIAKHPDEITRIRPLLTSLFSVIENVPSAPLDNPVVLCGSMFGLRVRRHRHFETNFPVAQPSCNHIVQGKVVGVYGNAGGSSKRDGLTFAGTDSRREAMGIDWMTGKELSEAIPPAYTEFIGRQLLKAI